MRDGNLSDVRWKENETTETRWSRALIAKGSCALIQIRSIWMDYYKQCI